MFSKFFLWCAGTSEELLDQCPESDLRHQQQLGAHVLLTAVLAFASSYISLSYAFQTESAIIWVFSSLWCLSIFMFDRTLIIAPILTVKLPPPSALVTQDADDESVNPYNRNPKPSSEPEISSGMAVIRTIMAILLALFIATPFELKIFEPEIQERISRINNETKKQDFDKDITDLQTKKEKDDTDFHKDKTQLAMPNGEQTALESEINGYEQEIQKRTKERQGEVNGTSGSKIIGFDKRAIQISNEIEGLENKKTQAQHKLQAVLKQLDQDKAAILAKHQSSQDKYKLDIEVLQERQKLLATVHSEKDKQDAIKRLTKETGTSIANPDIKITKAIADEDLKKEALLGFEPKEVSKASLLERIRALHQLFWGDLDVSFAIGVIILVFMLFELLPIAAKYFFSNSRYDILLAIEKIQAQKFYQSKVIRATEQFKRVRDEEETKTQAQQQANEQVLANNIGSEIFKAYFDKSTLAIGRFLNNIDIDNANDQDLESSFLDFFHQNLGRFELEETQNISSTAQQNTNVTPFHARRYFWLVIRRIVAFIIPFGFFLLYYQNLNPAITWQVIATAIGIFLATSVAFANLDVNARKLEIDSKPKNK